MADSSWYSEVEDKLYNIVKTRMVRELKALPTPITGVHYTTENASNAPSAFPTVYFHELQPAETGNDLENTVIHAVLDSIEIYVYDTNKNRGKKIMASAVNQMKALAFSVTMMPITVFSDNVYSTVARFRRTLGATEFENL